MTQTSHMWQYVLGIFFILHGAVHMLWVALSQGWVQDESIEWTGESWIFTNLLDDQTLSIFSQIMFVVATLLFIISGAVFMTEVEWRKTMLIISTIFSSIIILLFWDGTFRHLDDQGFIGIAINIIILVLVFAKVIVD